MPTWFFEPSPQSLNKVVTGDNSLYDGPSNPCIPYGMGEYLFIIKLLLLVKEKIHSRF